MSTKNKYGLSRYIPNHIERAVRKNSKFGCVVCRSAFYQYEHIDPNFEDAKKHDENGICCLCGSCHDRVSRSYLSKEFIKKKYSEIRQKKFEDVKRPVGPIDFHDGRAELKIAGLKYNPFVKIVLRYHDKDLITLKPGKNGEFGAIDAVFTDDLGQPTLELKDNAWIGNLNNWDIEVTSGRIIVRQKKGKIVLKLKLDPPGKIIIERLDMRYKNCHLLISEDSYLVGRYIDDNQIIWVNTKINFQENREDGVVFDFVGRDKIELLHYFYKDNGMGTKDKKIIMNADIGVMIKDIGIIIGSFSGNFSFSSFLITKEINVEKARKMIFNKKGMFSNK